MRDQRVEVPPFPTKFLAGALALVGIAFAWFTWNIYQSYRVAEIVKERYLRIEELRGMIVHLDEVLTMSARMAAATGDPQWEERYRQFEPPLDAAIKEAIALAPHSDIANLAAQTDEANQKLVEVENRAFALVRAGRPAAARAVLFSDEYERQKKVYAQGMRNFDTQLDEFLRATLRWERDKAVFSLIVTLVVLAFSASAWIAVVRLLRRWRVIILAALRRAEEALRGKTDLLTNTSHELQTPLKSIIGFWSMLRGRTIGPLGRKDEIGVLVEAIDQMAANLRTSTVSRAYLNNILRSMADPLIVLEVDATIRSVNRAALELLQYEGHELAGKPARALFGTDAFGEEGIEDLLRTGFLRNIESTCVTKGGHEVPVALSGAVMRDGDGRLEGIVCVAKDITERKRIEATHQALHRAGLQIQEALTLQERLSRLLQTAQEVLKLDRVNVLLADPKGEWLQAVAGLGTGQPLEEIRVPIGPEGGGLARTFLTGQAVVWNGQGPVPEELRLKPPYDRIEAFRSRVFANIPLVVHGRPIGVIGADRKRSQRPFEPGLLDLLQLFGGQAALAIEQARLYEALAQQSALLQATLDNITQGISAFDKDLRLIAWNQRYFELRDLPPALARRGTPFADLIRYNAARGEYGPGDPEEQVAQRLALARSSEPQSFERTRPNGTVIEVRRNPMPVGGFVTTLTDITERKQADQMKSDFVSFVTHQLRTPLSGIKWMLELAAQEKSLPPEARSYITDAQAAGERLIRLVNDLLDISRLERGKLTIVPQEIHLGELTQCVLDELAPLIAEKGHHLAVTGAGEVPPVWVDPQLLQQVILNLTSNAIKYTPPGGEIAIRMGREDAAVCWAVQDSGIGIPKGAHDRLFEKFYRADNVYAIETEGTGLGLYLVRLILDQLEGRAWCESEEGKGATFTFTLPLRTGG